MIGFITFRCGLSLRVEAIESIECIGSGGGIVMRSGRYHDVDETPDKIGELILESIKDASKVAADIAQGIADDLYRRQGL